MTPNLTGPLMAGVALSAAFLAGVAILGIAAILWRKAETWGVSRWATGGLIVVGLVHLWRAGVVWQDGTVTVGGLVNLLVVAAGAVAVLATVAIKTLKRQAAPEE